MTPAYPDKTRRAIISVLVMMATVMVALDGTIANVALPRIQSSVSASQEQIVWVLTSYLIATAIFTPLSGWLAERFGRNRVMTISVLGFTIASAACGIANNLSELVVFRLIQGASGAALIPLSQAVLLDINPPERHGQAMALYGMGSIMGPILGPILGGWLTEDMSWRWVFFINVPFGLITFFGLPIFLPESRKAAASRFDLIGFGTLAIALASFQLVLDRGQQLDWFSSTEVCVEAGAVLVFAYIFVVHTFTSSNPFIKPAIFRDRNFLFGSLISFQLGLLVYGVLALLAPMLEQLMGYPVVTTGLVTAPRGIGTMVSMMLVGQIIGKVDSRWLVIGGLILCATSMYMFSHISLGMDSSLLVASGIIQGAGTGMIFVPLTTMVFATLAPQYRNEGSALYTLTRSMGSSIGISFLLTMTIRNAAIVHSRLVEHLRPDNPMLQMRAPDFDFNSPASVAGMLQEVARQAQMVSNIYSFRFIFIVTLVLIPVTFLMRSQKVGAKADPAAVHAD